MTDAKAKKKVSIGAAVDPWIKVYLQIIADELFNGNLSDALRWILEAVLGNDHEKMAYILDTIQDIQRPRQYQLNLTEFKDL